MYVPVATRNSTGGTWPPEMCVWQTCATMVFIPRCATASGHPRNGQLMDPAVGSGVGADPVSREHDVFVWRRGLTVWARVWAPADMCAGGCVSEPVWGGRPGWASPGLGPRAR